MGIEPIYDQEGRPLQGGFFFSAKGVGAGAKKKPARKRASPINPITMKAQRYTIFYLLIIKKNDNYIIVKK